MSIYHYTQPTGIIRFRDGTDGQAAMPGVTKPSFICRCCQQSRAITGRKPVVKGTSRYGYVCAACQ